MADEFKMITERVGLPGAVALLVGTALGMSIFVVPTQTAAEAGPSIALAILASVPPMILGVLLLLQLGGALPVAGGIYVYASRLVGPFWGLIGVAIPVIAVGSYLVFAALGFSRYLIGAFLSPSLIDGALEGTAIVAQTTGDATVFAELLLTVLAGWFVLLLFIALNYVGIQIVTKVQIGMVLVLIAGMIVFIVGGAFAFDPSNLTPMFPDGSGEPFEGGITPFIAAVVLLYIPFQGFSMIIEIGEELKNPIKNIPRVLAIGMAIVTVLSVALVVTLVGSTPWENTFVMEDGVRVPVEAGLAAESVGGAFLPSWAVAFIALAAILAAATTINTLLTSYSRTIMRAARDDVVPKSLAEVHDRYNTPHRALLVLGLPAVAVVPFAVVVDHMIAREVLDWLVVVVVTGIFIAFMIGGIALWRLPKEFPVRYEHSFYKLPMPVLKVVAVGNFIVSFVFTLFVATTAPSALVFVLICMVATAIIHHYRIKRYERKGIDLRRKMALLDKHEQVGETGDD